MLKGNLTKRFEDHFMNLSEFIEEFRESEIYETDPQDWRGYLAEDDYWVPDPELVYWPFQRRPEVSIIVS